jgi:accessory Sec system glycosylation protein GtfA
LTVYHINKGIGPSSSGIEYAQKYRFDLVKNFPEKQYFVFCDYIYSNYTRFTDNIGLDMDATLNAYKFMAGQKNHRSTYTVEAFQETLSADFTRQADGAKAVNFMSGEVLYKAWLVPDTQNIDRVDTIVSSRLQEVAHYTDRLTNIDYYSGKEIFCRYFFNENGNLSMRQFLQDNKIVSTFIDNLVLYGNSEFYDEFFRRLNFDKNDLVIIDRNTDIGAELLQNKHEAKFVVVVHAEHFSERMSDENWILWNNYYEYVFTNHKYIDYFVVSTDEQKANLERQFGIYGHPETKVVTIPVGFIEQLADGELIKQNKYKFLTASRLAAEKHIDVLVRAVAKAKQNIPELAFHIYGAGGLDKNLRDLIAQLDASDYIEMKGHQHLDNSVYGQYGGYLTASGSEGFGLTILEAVSACLPIIGLDVDYGNTEFIEDAVNGFRFERGTEEEQVDLFAEKIQKMVTELNYDKAIAFAKEKASFYLADNVRQLWRDFYDLNLYGNNEALAQLPAQAKDGGDSDRYE